MAPFFTLFRPPRDSQSRSYSTRLSEKYKAPANKSGPRTNHSDFCLAHRVCASLHAFRALFSASALLGLDRMATMPNVVTFDSRIQHTRKTDPAKDNRSGLTRGMTFLFTPSVVDLRPPRQCRIPSAFASLLRSQPCSPFLAPF